MASADEVKNVTGFTIGGVSPVGQLNKTDILIDNSLRKIYRFICCCRTSKLCFQDKFY